MSNVKNMEQILLRRLRNLRDNIQRELSIWKQHRCESIYDPVAVHRLQVEYQQVQEEIVELLNRGVE